MSTWNLFLVSMIAKIAMAPHCPHSTSSSVSFSAALQLCGVTSIAISISRCAVVLVGRLVYHSGRVGE